MHTDDALFARPASTFGAGDFWFTMKHLQPAARDTMDEKLILHCTDPEVIPADRAALIQALHGEGLMGEAFPFRGATHYHTGGNFLHLVTFLGCSPRVATRPADAAVTDTGFCHIEVSPILAEVAFLGGSNTKPPLCPRCRGRETQWRELLRTWSLEKQACGWTCAHCGPGAHPYRLNWREYGGFGRFYLAIWDIAEGTALPGERLLALLRAQTGCDWRFFYFAGKPFMQETSLA